MRIGHIFFVPIFAALLAAAPSRARAQAPPAATLPPADSAVLRAAAAPSADSDRDNPLHQIWQEKLRENPLPAASEGAPFRAPVPTPKPGLRLAPQPQETERERNRSQRSFEREQRMKRLEGEPDRPKGKNIYSIREPLVSPAGEPLVALVNDRYMTRGDLDLRLSILMNRLPPIENPDINVKLELIEKQKFDFSQSILDEWVVTTTLALEAARRGYKIDEADVEKSLAALVAQSHEAPTEFQKEVQMIGVPEAQLRAEARDALLVEKFVGDVVRQSFTEADLRRAYAIQPSYWLLPPRVRAFHVFKALDATMTEKQKKEVRRLMTELRKDLKKAKPDYEALAKRSDENAQVVVGDMGWVGADSALSPALLNVLFSLEVGATSEPFADGYGVHLVRVLEREEGSQMKFEEARPQIEAYLFSKMKLAVFDQLMPLYQIRMNSGGINNWREVTREEYAAHHEARRKSAPVQRPAPARIGRQPAAILAPGAGASPAAAPPPPAAAQPPPPAPAPRVELRSALPPADAADPGKPELPPELKPALPPEP